MIQGRSSNSSPTGSLFEPSLSQRTIVFCSISIAQASNTRPSSTFTATPTLSFGRYLLLRLQMSSSLAWTLPFSSPSVTMVENSREPLLSIRQREARSPMTSRRLTQSSTAIPYVVAEPLSGASNFRVAPKKATRRCLSNAHGSRRGEFRSASC